MARTIRLNTAGGGAAASSSGLGQADVERIIDDRVRGTVVYEKSIHPLCLVVMCH